MHLEKLITLGLDDSLSTDEKLAIVRQKDLPTASEESKDVVKWLKNDGNNLMWCTDNYFPEFGDISCKTPFFLLYKGNKPNGKEKCLGIVGTRRADQQGMQASFKFGLEYALNGINIVSGLAEGCDQAAAIGALEARKIMGSKAGKCLAIIGNGLERNYPSFTHGLKKRIIENGGSLISQFPPEYPPLKYNFPKRNIVIAGFSDILLVVQAPAKSGALITADFALQMGKEVFVSQAGIGQEPQRLGTNGLYVDGAMTMPAFPNGINVVKTDAEGPETIRFGSCFYVLKENGTSDKI